MDLEHAASHVLLEMGRESIAEKKFTEAANLLSMAVTKLVRTPSAPGRLDL